MLLALLICFLLFYFLRIGLLELVVVFLLVAMLFGGTTINGHGIYWYHNNISWH